MAADSVYGENTEMYLKTLIELTADREVVPVTGLAERLGISTVSASEKVRRLQDQGFVEHLPYKGVSLTEAGLTRAHTVLRRHRLWERFLVDYLNVEWENAHEAACRLEHATSREISERLAVFLGQPKTCPHGNPIPSLEASPYPKPELRLHQIDAPVQIVVMRVFPESETLLSEIVSMDLMPGTCAKVISPSGDEEPAQLIINDNLVTIPVEIARYLYIRILNENEVTQ
jgi:DtxR family Mn-dependent transcriptional regulator